MGAFLGAAATTVNLANASGVLGGIASALGLGGRIDPALAHSFSVEIDGLIVGGFTEASGLNAQVQVVSIPEGGQNEYLEQRINAAKHPNLVLKRGITSADMLWSWCREVAGGTVTRRDGSVVLMTKDLTEMWRWNFRGAYPVSWAGPVFKADQSAVAFESIELVHRGIEKDFGPMGGSPIGMVSAGVGAGAAVGAKFS